MNRLFLALLLSLILRAIAGAADPREASAILKDYESVTDPTLDAAKLNDQTYVRKFVEERKAAMEKRGALALELYQSHPDHPRAAELMVERWSSMTQPGVSKTEMAIAEMDKFLKAHPQSQAKADVLYQRAAAIDQSDRTDMQKNQAVEDFIHAFPKDERGADLLFSAADRIEDKPERLKLLRRIVADYSGSSAAKMAAGSIRQIDEIGKPFALDFKDAIGGKPVSIKDLKGKVVVIDFWATWCSPCVAEMPKMKEFYAKYKPEGVEFIGVSLDNPDGGLDKLKAFVREKEITWPQYYQGHGWESEFSSSWGINGIPTLFIVDRLGNLHSTEARGELESLIPELLKKRDG